jgi:hypothetical protein
MMSAEHVLVSRAMATSEPDRRQELAIDRIELAVSELASVLLSHCRSGDIARSSIRAVRSAVMPVLADILAAN